jgi:precorrin-8X/cobalt-precorrin-8 methylmutase
VSVFERYVTVDWSAASRPARGRDSIWIAVADPDGRVTTVNPPTRRAALDELDSVLDRRPTIVAVDASLGYPAGTASALGLGGDAAPWHSTWRLIADLIEDGEDNGNNRFEVAAELNRRISGGATPFWGCPPSRRSPTLVSTKPPSSPLPEWRAVEDELRAAGHRPFSCWQLLGAGSVGSQTLLAIPALDELGRRLAARRLPLEVWPFTTGLRAPAEGVTVAEVWPRLVRSPVADRVPDRGQVIAVVERLRTLDDEERLESRLCPDVPRDLVDRVVDEEGWILDPG